MRASGRLLAHRHITAAAIVAADDDTGARVDDAAALGAAHPHRCEPRWSGGLVAERSQRRRTHGRDSHRPIMRRGPTTG